MDIWKKLPVVGNLIDTASGMYDSYKNRQMQNDAMHNSISYRVADAKRAGIHPLAALGAATYSPRPISTGTNFERMGQSLEKLSPSNSMHEKTARRLDLEYRQEQINNIRQSTLESKARTEGHSNNSMSGLGNSSPIPGISSPRLDDPGIQYKPNEVPVSRTVGIASGNSPFEQQSTTMYGTVYKTPTKEIQEAISEGSLFTQLKYNLGQVADYFAGYGTYLAPKAMKETKKLLGKTRPPASPNYEYRYNVFRGAWVLREKKGTSRFWDHTARPKRAKFRKFPKTKRTIWDE